MKTRCRALRALVVLGGLALAAGCGKSSNSGRSDPINVVADASLTDAGPDGSLPEADAGNGAIEFGTPGPWPLDPVTVYGRAQEILESNVLEASSDEAQNLWAVTSAALYLLRPGDTSFRRYTAEDGLNLDNALPEGSPRITAVVGGGPNEAFVGYQGSEVRDPQQDEDRHRGKLDRVQLQPDGTLLVTFYDVHNNDAVGIERAPGEKAKRLPDGRVDPSQIRRLPDGSVDPQFTDWSYNENRTVLRFLYDHMFNRGSLYVGYNHSVGRIDAGRIDPVHGFDYADHVHPDVVAMLNGEPTPRMGDWNGLAIDPSPRRNAYGELKPGMLWMGGRWNGGARHWTLGLWEWTDYRENPFSPAFGGGGSPPIFAVTPGEDIYITGIAALSDGTVFFASGPLWGFSNPRWIARYKDGAFTYLSPESDIGLPSRDIIDLQRLPDDTVLIALRSSLWRWDPSPAPGGRLLGRIEGLPGGRINRVNVDPMVDPVAVYVATDQGFAVLRLE